jgi:polyisoprenoid-binding protein YceI
VTATAPAPALRQRDGFPLPVTGTWTIDPGHAEVAFVGRHFMLTKVRGRFTEVAGSVEVAEDPAASQVTVTIGTASVNSGDATRDAHLRSAEMFDVEAYPTATFRSAAIDWRGPDGTVHGDLTIRGVTRRVPLEVSFVGAARDPWGADRAVFSARTQINREDFGLTWNMVLETGGLLVSKEIQIEIEVETIRSR